MFDDIIARLSVVLGMDTAAFEKGATIAEKRTAQAQRKLEKFGRKIGNIGKTMSIGITAPLTAFGYSAFNAASDAAELQSAFDQTFAGMTGAMNEWAVATGDAMGRSTQEIQRGANTFGIFFNQAAGTRQEAAEMSKAFTVLTQDLASFYNVSESDALQKLRSGLAGEAEPLRDFGVFLSAAAVEAKAMQLGLADASGEISEQAKIMARYQLILEGTTNAQGDVARTSEGTANRMRAAKAAFEELQVVVGTKLLPVLTPLIDKLAAALEWFTGLPQPVQDTVLVVAALAAAFGPVLTAFGALLPLLGPIAVGVKAVGAALLLIAANPVILALAGVIAGIYAAWKHWDKITAIVAKLYHGVKNWLQDKLGAVLDWVRGKVEKVEGAFRWLWDRVVGNSWVPDMVDGIEHHFARLDKVMVDPADKAARSVSDRMRDMASETRQLLGRLFPEIERLLQYREDLKLIEGAGLSSDQEAEARRRLAGLTPGYNPGIQTEQGSLIDNEAVEKNIERFNRTVLKMGAKAKEGTVRVAQSFRQMAQDTVSSLGDMVNAIKGGGFFDILGGILDFGMQLASIGVFGKGMAARVNASIPGYANGTRNHPGGLAMVGERGAELVSMPRGSSVFTNSESRRMMQGGRQVVEIVDTTGLFKFRVDQQISDAAPSIMDGGAQLARAKDVFSRSRRLA